MFAGSLFLENPGSIRVGKAQMLRGDKSDPRSADVAKATNKIEKNPFSPRTKSQLDAILEQTKDGERRPSSEFMAVLNLQETRTRDLLRILVTFGKIVDDGAIKGRLYRRVDRRRLHIHNIFEVVLCPRPILTTPRIFDLRSRWSSPCAQSLAR